MAESSITYCQICEAKNRRIEALERRVYARDMVIKEMIEELKLLRGAKSTASGKLQNDTSNKNDSDRGDDIIKPGELEKLLEGL